MPASAPLPTPTMSAAGVAMPSAQGQAMISTAMKASSACGKLPAAHQPSEGEDGDADHRRHEVARHLVGQALDLRGAGLRLLDQLDDLRQRRVRADARRPEPEASRCG